MQQDSLLQALSRFHSGRVLVLGDVMLDRFVYGSVERISPEAPIPVLRVERYADMPGGAANVARNVAALGGNTVLLGVVGDDAWAQDLSRQLQASPSVELQFVIDPSRDTTIKTRYVADGQQVMRADRESRKSVCELVERQLLDRLVDTVRKVDVVVLSDYAKGVLSDTVTREAIRIARAEGKTVIVDPKTRDFSKYRGASVLTPNRSELQAACGQECISDDQVVREAQAILKQQICELMLVTRGKDGMSIIRNDGEATHLPTAAKQVFDVSGAGDTVVATLSLGLAAGCDITEAAAVANAAAGIVVGKRGTAVVTTGEIAGVLRQFDGRSGLNKIFDLESALQMTRQWREQGLKIAFTNGCFDLLHPGHISLLNQARQSADRLVVGLNSDLSIRRLKGPNRPVQSEVSRATVLAAVKSVDAVVIFSEDTPLALLEALEPDVLVKGADYTVATVVGADLIMKRGGRVVLAELLQGHSTSATVARVRAAQG
jgi:D-beta-D-heptose 7-phosphate kinase/D-beta-D-heptose 1-phosphate adenosyltransferase